MTRTFPFALALLLAATPAAAQDLKSPPSPTDEVEPTKGDLDDPPDKDEEQSAGAEAKPAPDVAGASSQSLPDEGEDAGRPPTGVNDRARELYQEGRKAFNIGDFSAAVGKFKEAYTLSEKPALLYNIAFAHDKAGERERAVFFYERYLAEDSDAPEERRAEVSARIKVLKEEQAAAEKVKRELKKAARPAPVKAAPKRVETPIYKKWWLWTIVGVVVAGGVATGVVLGTRQKDADIPPSELGEIRGNLGFPWR